MTSFAVVAAVLYLVPALVWGIMARQLAEYARSCARGGLFVAAPLFMATMAFTFLVYAAQALLPPGDGSPPALGRVLHALHDAGELASFLFAFHTVRLMPVGGTAPARLPTTVDVVAVPILLAVVALRLVPGAVGAHAVDVLFFGTQAVLATVCVLAGLRMARPGAAGPEAAVEMRSTDLALMAAGIAVAGIAGVAAELAGSPALARVLFIAGVGVAIAVPWTTRVLGVLLPESIVTVVLALAMVALFAGHRAAFARVRPALHPLLDFATLLALGIMVVPGQRWLRTGVDRLVFRRSRRQLAELTAFLHGLSPELGIVECCRRALAELVRVRALRGAAIILRGGETVVAGEFDVEPLRRVWPIGAAADALPARSFGTAELREMPLALREALVEARVALGASPILGPRRRWGHLFMNTGLLGGVFREDDLQEFHAVVGQLALILDAADLLARAVAVERSLAHAEKLAAVGETAARIAHEIRNPVTAARSLAQQLARDPTSPLNAEHAVLILAELERVERQVGALLRFSRREELRVEPTDLAALACATVESLRPRLEAAGITVALDTGEAIVAPVDGEKVRQVLVNLLENAMDALADAPAERRVRVTVAGRNGAAVVAVADTGPGVSPDALPQLFEPFFSLKAQGTGLGLAIAKRTVEAHGGRIAARPGASSGLEVRFEVPLG